MNQFSKQVAFADFDKARKREIVTRLLGFISRQKQELLSFEDVKSMLRPQAQSYRGLQAVPIRLIVGSEGRYQDFDNQFLPRKEHLRSRWARVDEAHHEDIILPPISLYELGGVYFVRDGNHRVSVAKSLNAESIDAEVLGLDSEIQITPGIDADALRDLVIGYEYQKFLQKTGLLELFPEADLRLSSTGQYDEILLHIMGHKYFINQGQASEIPFPTAVQSWYEQVFLPIVEIVREEALLERFPGRTEADLYVWIIKHWHYLKEKYGNEVTLRDAASSYSNLFGQSTIKRFRKFWERLRIFRRKPD